VVIKMAGSAGINYRETYFEFPDLTKIHGEPTSGSLYKLRNELKANAQSVSTNLSDGTHGHLALVLSAHNYSLLTAEPFIRPVHPGALDIPAGTTAPMSAVLKEAHHEQLRLFREVQGVEKAMIQQIVRAVDAPYLIALRDRNSNSLTGTVYEILDHLQQVYGRVSPQMLEDRETELKAMTYNPKTPIDTVFNAVDDLADFASLGMQPLTEGQIIAKAYIIINNTRRFKLPINEWNRKPAADKNWNSFKTHFRQAHREFRETTDVTIEESELESNQANFVQRVIEGLRAADADETENDPSANLMQEMANSATRSEATQQQLATQLREVTQTLANLQAQVQQQPPQYQPVQPPQFQYPPPQYQQGYQNGYPHQYQHQGRGRFGYQGRGRGRRGRGRGAYRARNTTMYCWTHGACGHTSNTCMYKTTGHQDTATFQNTQGGSTQNCPPPTA
jgi:hypothetical protein